MKIKVTVLSPVHIGSGEEISPTEYFIDRERGWFNRLNLNSLFLDERFKAHRERFITGAARSRYIGQIISDHSLLNKHILYSIPISSEARQEIINSPKNIKTFVKSAGRVYLPGSSLKGSILSAFLWYFLREISKEEKAKIEEIIIAGKGKSAEAYDKLLNLVFSRVARVGPRPEKAKFTHWLDLGDSDPVLPEKSLQISLVKVKGTRRGGEISIFYETIKKGQIFWMEIKATEMLKKSQFSEKELLRIAHDFYLRVAKKDGVNVPDDPHLLRLGQGATAFSTSLLLLAEDLQLRGYTLKPPRTRKRINDDTPMGFIQICL